MLTSFLDSKFSQNRRVPLKALVLRITSGQIIPKGSLVLMASGDRRIRLKILDEDAIHKNFSEPLIVNGFGGEHKITPYYLMWYLSQEPVTEYLLQNARGAVFVRVPRKILHAISVPLPTSVTNIKPINEFSVARTDTPFSKLIADFYRDYLLNVTHGRYRTASVVAGAICEIILYQLLVEQGVSQSLLKSDRALGFNKLIDYVRVLKLDQLPAFPLSQLVQMQKNRNHAIHAGLLVYSERGFGSDDLDCFNPIIKYFGL